MTTRDEENAATGGQLLHAFPNLVVGAQARRILIRAAVHSCSAEQTPFRMHDKTSHNRRGHMATLAEG